MISSSSLSVGNLVSSSPVQNSGNSAMGSCITRVDNAFVTMGSGTTSLKVPILLYSESFSYIPESSIAV